MEGQVLCIRIVQSQFLPRQRSLTRYRYEVDDAGSPHNRRGLTDQELETIRFAAGRSGTRDHTLVVFLAATGLRLNEARELRVADLNLDQCQVTVRAMTSKVRRSRTVDFHAAVAKEMDRYLRKRQNLSADAPLLSHR